MLSSEQQRELRRDILKGLTCENKYDHASLQVQFKQTLIVQARKIPLPEPEVDAIVSSSSNEVFRDYAVGGAGRGAGLLALIRVYGAVRGAGHAGELRERMQQLAEENAIHGPSESA